MFTDVVGAVSGYPRLLRGPFPQEYVCEMRYCDTLTLTAPSSNNSTSYTYALGNAQKPDVNNTGHKPYGWDTLDALYGFYQVLAVSAEIQFCDPSATLGVGYQLMGQAPGAVFYQVLAERPGVRSVVMSQNGEGRYTFRIRANPWDLVGVPRQAYMADVNNYGAGIGTVPANTIPLFLFAASFIAGTAETVNVVVKFTFKIRFWQRTSLAQST
jgi:hypothetical protein